MPGPHPPFLRLLNGYAKAPNGCWEWTGFTHKVGYGQLKAFGKTVFVHRFSYELHKGPIPDGLEVMHSCDNKKCINPDHLSVGTHAENMAAAKDRGLMPKGEKHPMFGTKNPRPMQANIVRVIGVVYESQKAAERALGLGSGTVRYWLKTNSGKASIIKGPEK